jgi:tetrahydromethanopterin S-methyltransferase subunit A
LNTLKIKLDYYAGQACKILFPITVDFFKGRGSNIALCALSSIELLKTISKSEMMNKLVIAGRLFSENKGIDKIIEYCLDNPKIEYIILCGKDTKGHYPGDALICLLKNGVSKDGQILGTVAPYPFINSNEENVERFKMQISVIDLRNCFDLNKISNVVNRLGY